MASVTYSESLSNGINVSSGSVRTLTGSPLPANATITGVQYSVRLSASKYSSSKEWVLSEIAVGGKGGSPRATSVTAPMSSTNYTFTGAMSYTASDVNMFDGSDLSVYVMAYTTYDTTSYYWGTTITVNYEVYTAVEPPTTLELSSASVAPGAKVTLSWGGARAGDANPITGYRVYRANTVDGVYSLLTTVSATDTSASTTVVAPSTNGASYFYKVQTVGTAAGFDSAQSETTAELTCTYATVGAPTSLQLSMTNAAPNAEATLSWSGATEGDNNAITGYEIYRATSSGGAYSLLTTVASTETADSATVHAPASSGEAYYFKVRTLGSLAGSDSPLSTGYASLTCTYSSPNAPTSVTIAGTSPTYALPSTSVLLTWSGASGGANNAIVGYDIYRNGEPWVSGLSASTSSYTVTSHETAGNGYSYSVVAVGAHSNSSPSVSCTLYSYTDPTAPTELSVTNEVPAAGSRVVLSWSGAAPGGYNDIKGYRVYRSSTEDGTYTQVAVVDSTSATHSCYVVAPSTVGSYYYYRVETVGAYSLSGLSDAVIAVGAGEAVDGGDDSVDVVVPPETKRAKRGFILGDYNTAAKGWTLTGWSFPEPETQTNYVAVPGRAAGPLDMSTALTGGDPRYNSRELTVTLECSEGTRLDRDDLIEEMANRLHGMREEIIFPDDATRYAVGRLSVETEYSDMAHCAVTVTGTCEPWRYSREETHISLLATERVATAVLYNGGRRVVVPEVVVSGYGAQVRLACGGREWTLSTGKYKLPELSLPKGNALLTYSGTGAVSITYREAII